MAVDVTELWNARIREEIERQTQFLETACEKALLTGTDGVLVVQTDLTMTPISAEPDPRVPYGQIWYLPLSGLDAFESRYSDHG